MRNLFFIEGRKVKIANSRRRLKLGTIVLMLFCLAALMIVLPSVSNAAWTIEAVDAPNLFSALSERALAIDGSNRPHSVYAGDNLYYAYFDGSQWQYEVVDGSEQTVLNASIAIDSNNKVHISYHDVTNFDLKYATNASGSWQTVSIDEYGGYYSSIAVDSNNKVHIGYYGGSPSGDLKYATNASGSWQTITVDSTENVGQFP